MSAASTAGLPPYATTMGMRVVEGQDTIPVIQLSPSDKVMGRPGFLHGGAISGLMEIAAIAALRSEMAQSGNKGSAKPVNITVDFMRGGNMEPTFAAGRVTRIGRRVANVEAAAWQGDRDKPIAAARMIFLIREES